VLSTGRPKAETAADRQRRRHDQRPVTWSLAISVDRHRQHAAIRRHASQSSHNPVLWRRLQLLGPYEYLRWLTPAPSAPPK
jgi:hypothetical protein